MDALAGLLDGPRAHRAFLLRVVMSPPWSITVEDEAPLTLVVMTRGTAVLTGSSGRSTLAAGDVVLARGPGAVRRRGLGRDAPADIRILPGQQCIDPHGRLLDQAMALGVRTWGNAVDGETVMLIGTYEDATEVGSRRAVAAARRTSSCAASTARSSPCCPSEMTRDVPGQEAVLDRLLDLLLVTCSARLFEGERRARVVRRARRPGRRQGGAA